MFPFFIPAISDTLVNFAKSVTAEAEVKVVRDPMLGHEGHEVVSCSKGDVMVEAVGVTNRQTADMLTGQCEAAAVDGPELFKNLE